VIERQKHKYFLICLAASIPPLVLFGIDDLMAGRHLEALLTFAQGVLFICLFIWGVLSKSTVLLRAGMFIFSIFLFYLIIGGTGSGYGSLWVYTFPLASFYMLDKREGIVWTVCFYVLMALVLLLPASDEVRALDTAFVIRLLSTFLVVSIMAYAYAAVRDRIHWQMQMELEEKKMLLKEIHHRVKNNLTIVQSILSLQCGAVSDEASRSVFLESQSRINSMSLLHEALYSQSESSRVEVSGYLGSIVRHLSDSYVIQARDAEVLTHIQETWFDVELAMPCGIIANELLSNVFKYAVPEKGGLRARVSLTSTPEGEYVLSVTDNGRGMPEDFDIKAAGTYGMKIVNAFVEQIGGRLEVQSGPEGTEFRLTFSPPELPRQAMQS
jgi:two-component sensor histidine kinase